MLTSFGGRERSLGEYTALLEAAGLKATNLTATRAFPFSIIEAVRSDDHED
jgi:hypothetical protein